MMQLKIRMDMILTDGWMDTGAWVYYEPRHEKTGFLHMRKQRRRSASR